MKQDSEEAFLGCHSDVDNTWRLVCHGSAWIGDHRNCTSGMHETMFLDLFTIAHTPFSLSHRFLSDVA